MRSNLPVTDREIMLRDDHAIVSKTDLDGNITYVNPYFVEISGYTEAELLGQPQNILRHPDMPAAAFADLWATVRAGRPWTGMVKNRCKNGDFYWVRANVTPMREDGRSVGYMSVRVRPQAQEVEAAQRAYHAIVHGNPAGLLVRDGEVLASGWAQRLGRLAQLSLRQRIWGATSVVNLLLAGVCLAALLGADGLSGASAAVMAATAAGLLINVFLWYTLRSHVLSPLEQAVQGARAIAAGDLSGSFDTSSRDEMGELQRALQQMSCNLIATIRDVRMNVETMATATCQIAAGNADLSGRTEAQAASLEETASSVEQFSATVKQNAEHSMEANALAQTANEVAVQGGAIVDEVIATMDGINASSRQVVEIIGLIEGIAFQTNILALNAAVEAARAGEQGRGFAVVASEVRNLAQRSATAAKDIKRLIEVSLGKVSGGMEQVQRAGSTMRSVVTSVQQVSNIMAQISHASREQSIGVDQVNAAVAEMDQVTQQNAALVEEAAAAAGSLALEAQSLSLAVSVFHFGPARSAPARRDAGMSLLPASRQALASRKQPAARRLAA
ncbi:PAS domain S-box protein [Oxalobacteraceae bacterium]|nr:PAS domain S-box protein [Oxalobacteraceae bacterium]